MPCTHANRALSKKAVRTGRALSGLAMVFLLLDGIINPVPITPVAETLVQPCSAPPELFAWSGLFLPVARVRARLPWRREDYLA